jgi:hypothetical protein
MNELNKIAPDIPISICVSYGKYYRCDVSNTSLNKNLTTLKFCNVLFSTQASNIRISHRLYAFVIFLRFVTWFILAGMLV